MFQPASVISCCNTAPSASATATWPSTAKLWRMSSGTFAKLTSNSPVTIDKPVRSVVLLYLQFNPTVPNASHLFSLNPAIAKQGSVDSRCTATTPSLAPAPRAPTGATQAAPVHPHRPSSSHFVWLPPALAHSTATRSASAGTHSPESRRQAAVAPQALLRPWRMHMWVRLALCSWWRAAVSFTTQVPPAHRHPDTHSTSSRPRHRVPDAFRACASAAVLFTMHSVSFR
mmetsp:Transcript_13938/g.35146  ORF Transcript_13938/g.35146 Transcript_13938/m.35146 type:complete len:229 (+) Transcript_13938:1093-1779(+)